MGGHILVTGGSGFVGSAVIAELIARGFTVHALVHRTPICVEAAGDDLKLFTGGLFDDHAINNAAEGCRAIIHLVGIIRQKTSEGVTFEHLHLEGTRRIIDAAMQAGVGRFIHMSALGTRPEARSEYHQTKYRAEQIVRASPLDWTIIRPSLILGSGGEFWEMEKKWATGKSAPWLFMPYFGRGFLGQNSALLQPIHVKDVARAIVSSIDNPRTCARAYDLGGADRLTWPELHRLATQLIVGKSRPALGIPGWKGRLLATCLPPSWLSFNRDQIIMALEDNTADMDPFIADFGWMPKGCRQFFSEENKEF